jgi:hypothetical protein
MRSAAQIILWVSEIYLLAGIAVALGFAAVGIHRVLPEAGHLTLGARLIVLPAAALLWPKILHRWWTR